jgi:toxin CcdB
MARFDLYRSERGYNLDVQTGLLSEFDTRLVVPLLPREAAPPPERRLNPQFEIEGQPYLMMTQYMSAVRRKILGRPVGNLDAEYDRILSAISMIFSGF